MVLFGLGSSSVLGLGSSAKQDAWISILLAGVTGIALFVFVYGTIFKTYPDQNFTATIKSIFGKPIGTVITMFYILYFLFISTLVLRDIGELVITYILPGTPILAIQFMAVIVMAYAVYLGIETMGRSAELYIFPVFFFIIFIAVFLLISGAVQFSNLLPIMENGYKPIVQAAYPLVLAFPFGELIVFNMILYHVNKKQTAIKTGALAMGTTMLLITFITIMNITAIGIYLTENSPFPTVKMVRMINVAEFVQRLDSIAVVMFLIGSIAKITVYGYVVNTGLKDLFQKPYNYNKFIIPIFLIILLGSVYFYDSFTQQIYIGLKLVPYYVNFPFEVVLPTLMVVIIYFKKFFIRSKN